MARLLRIHYPGAIYHVTGRMLGNWRDQRDRLFRDDRDRHRFLERLEQGIVNFDVRLYLFCLMSNHFHLLVETPQGNLSPFMQSLNTGYTVYFNLRHQRHGHLFDGRYKAHLVAGDEYLLKLSRYIHQNPVCVASWVKRTMSDRVERMRAYRWSSYRGYIGADKAFEFVDEGPILAMMAGGKNNKRKGYGEYVESGLARKDEDLREALKKRSLGIGDQNFQILVDRIRNRKLKMQWRPEDASFRRVTLPLKPNMVLKEVAKAFSIRTDELIARRRNSMLRPIAARSLLKFCGCTQREIAELLGLTTGAAVSLQIKRLKRVEETDRKTARKIQALEKVLRKRQEAKGNRAGK